MKDKKPLMFGLYAGGIASLCCIGPVILVGLGLSSVSFALSVGKYTSVFLTLGILFLLGSLLVYYKKKNACSLVGLKQNWKQILGAFLIAVVILLFLKYWLAGYIAKIVYS